MPVMEEEEILSKPIISAFNERIEQAPPNDEHAAVIEKVAEVDNPPANDLEKANEPTYSGVSGEKENESYVLPPPSLLRQTSDQ